jgi:muramoyltetrapeptide carboxypeptidase
LLVGYSDVTALHLAAYSEARLSGLSGPVVTEWAEAGAAILASFRAWSRGDRPSVVDAFDAR